MSIKIRLKDRTTGQVIEVTKNAYQMRKSKYDKTHAVVNPAPKPHADVKIADEPTQVVSETTGSETSEEEQAPARERQKPGPKPKNKEA